MILNKFVNPVSAALGEGAGIGILSSCIHGDSVQDTTNSTSLMTVRGFQLPAKALANLGDCLEVFAVGRVYANNIEEVKVELGGQVLWFMPNTWAGLPGALVWNMSSKIWRVTSGAVQHYTTWELETVEKFSTLGFATVDLTANNDFNIRARSSDLSYPFTVEVSTAKVLNVPV